MANYRLDEEDDLHPANRCPIDMIHGVQSEEGHDDWSSFTFGINQCCF